MDGDGEGDEDREWRITKIYKGHSTQIAYIEHLLVSQLFSLDGKLYYLGICE
jgi:hypothetical protein